MRLPFGLEADFSGISQSEALRIAKVIHQAMINVDERGTEATATTVVGFVVAAAPPFSFRADHPFLFLLRDSRTGTVLFAGRMTGVQR
jgi:serpin B